MWSRIAGELLSKTTEDLQWFLKHVTVAMIPF